MHYSSAFNNRIICFNVLLQLLQLQPKLGADVSQKNNQRENLVFITDVLPDEDFCD